MTDLNLSQIYDEAAALKNQGKFDEAVEGFMRIVNHDPNHMLAHAALAVVQQKRGKYDEAIQHAIRVTELNPNDSMSFTQLSVIYQRCGKFMEAEVARDRVNQLRQQCGSGGCGHH